VRGTIRYGQLVVSITFHKGQPQEMRVLDRKPHYRLGGGLPAKEEWEGSG
jgi:hypothetical protein